MRLEDISLNQRLLDNQEKRKVVKVEREIIDVSERYRHNAN